MMSEYRPYKEWYQKRAFKLAKLLMKALHVAFDINEADSLWRVIHEKIESLNLPDQKCKRCGVKMKYWEWAINQGYCRDCISELEEEMKER